MTERLDYAKLYNPYDFSNPVTSRDLFVGRQRELDDLHYYLDQASKAPRPINIAALGPRASGKTSLLNMIALDANVRGFCVARVDLNESDAESPMASSLRSLTAFSMQPAVTQAPAGSRLALGGRQARRMTFIST